MDESELIRCHSSRFMNLRLLVVGYSEPDSVVVFNRVKCAVLEKRVISGPRSFPFSLPVEVYL